MNFLLDTNVCVSLIAAIAVANGLVLVTSNTAEFSRAPGLSIEDWQTS